MTSIIALARAAGYTLPPPPPPSARYVPWKKTGNLLYLSGQVSDDGNGGIKGTVGADVTLQQGALAAQASALRLISQISDALEDDARRIVQLVKISGFVQAANDFSAIPQVIDGCSAVLVRVFGDAGTHARSSVGVLRLPRGYAVEIEAIVEIRD